MQSEKVCSPEYFGLLLQEAEWLQLSGWCNLDLEAELFVASTCISYSCNQILDCLLSTSQPVFTFRRSFAFSHSVNRQRQQQPAEDIETGQVSTAGQQADNDDCLPRAAGLASATSAPNALQRQSIQSAVDSVMPASPSHLQTRSSTLSNGAASPAASPTAQVSSAAMLGRLLSAGNKSLKRSPSGTQPVCLICLENLTPEDFEVQLLLVLTRT